MSVGPRAEKFDIVSNAMGAHKREIFLFLTEFGPKNQNSQVKLKFGT